MKGMQSTEKSWSSDYKYTYIQLTTCSLYAVHKYTAKYERIFRLIVVCYYRLEVCDGSCYQFLSNGKCVTSLFHLDILHKKKNRFDLYCK